MKDNGEEKSYPSSGSGQETSRPNRPPLTPLGSAVNCSGEVNLASAPVATVDRGSGAHAEDVRVLMFGDGPVRCVGSIRPVRRSAASIIPMPVGTMPYLPFTAAADSPTAPAAVPLSGPNNLTVFKELHRIHRLLRGRYLYALILALVLGSTGAYLGFRLGAKTFRSSGAIRIMPVVPKIMFDVDEKGTMPMYETFMEAQMALLKSRRVIDQALDEEPWLQLPHHASKTDQLLAAFEEELEITRQGELLWVRVTNLDPQIAVAAVDATISAYLKVYAQLEAESGDKRREAREAVQAKLREDWNELQRQIRALAQDHGTDDLKGEVEFEREKRNELERQLQTVQIAEALANQRGPATVPVINQPEDVALIFGDQEMWGLLRLKWAYEAQLDIAHDEGRGGAAVQKMRADLQIVRKQIDTYAEQFKKTLANRQVLPEEKDPALLENRKQTLTAMHTEVDAKLKAIGTKGLKITELHQRAAEVKEKLDEATRAIERLDVESRVMGRIVVMSQGDRPLRAFRDTRPSTAVAGGMAGIAVGLGSMILLGLLNLRLDRPEDEDLQSAHLPMLGVIPVLPDDLSDPEHGALAAYCVHDIRMRLQLLGQQQGGRGTFGITSATAGAGKTSLTLALGLSFAAGNQRTLLIDCDMVGGGLTRRIQAGARRRIGAILLRDGLITQEQLEEGLRESAQRGCRLGLTLVELGYLTESELASAMAMQQNEALGLLEALDGEDVLSCVTGTGVEGLYAMPLGNATVRDAASLSLSAFRRLLDRASRYFEVIIVDTGPVLGSLEVSVVASQADAVVLAVSKGEPRSVVAKSIAQLSVFGTRVAGMVFNRARGQDVVKYGSHKSSSCSMLAAGEEAPRGRREVPGVDRLGPVARAVATWSPTPNFGSRRSRVRDADLAVASSEAS